MRRKRSIVAMLTAALLVGVAPACADDLRGVALVIGESDYDSDKLQDLGNPKNDARAMDDLLTSLGFEVERALNDDRADLEDDAKRFLRNAKGADVALIYYSGHGIEAGGENYLVPADADLTSPATAGKSLVPIKELVEPLQVGMDNGAKRALIPIENKRSFLEVTADVMEHVDPVFFGDPKTAALKALGLN